MALPPLALALALAVSRSASAADVRVGPGQAYGDLAAGLAAAAAGDRVLVWPGLYAPAVVASTVEIVGTELGAVVIAADDGVPALEVLPYVEATLRGLVLDGVGEQRALVIGAGAVVAIEDGTVRDGVVSGFGGCVNVDAATLSMRRTTVSGCTADSGGGIYAVDSALALDAVTVADCTATSGFGGGVGVERSSLDAAGTRFERNLALDPIGDEHNRGLGGGLFTGTVTLGLHGCAFVGNEARSVASPAGRGGGVRLWLTDAVIDGCTFDGNGAHTYGSAIAAASSPLWLSGTRLVGNAVDVDEPDPAHGGALFCDASSPCDVDRSWFEGNSAGDGGAVCALGDVTLTTSMFCANQATSDGGAIDLGNAVDGAVATVAGNAVIGNDASDGGGIVVAAREQHVHNNHVIANTAASGAAIGHTSGLTAGLELLGNLFAGNTSVDGPVISVGEVPVSEGWTAAWSNAPETASFALGSGQVTDDPELAGPLGSCAAEDLALAASSPLVDAGDPTDTARDADGTRNDIGAFGGPYGDPGAFVDADHDGVPAMADCDDADASVFPGADERCGGGDEDCDGLVDEDDLAIDAGWLHPDTDGDGAGVEGGERWRCPGPGWADTADDCDGDDPAVAGPIPWYVDADGDGFGDPSTATVGCEGPPGAILVGGDCDDTDPAVAGGCDDGTLPADSDGDGLPDPADPEPFDAGGAMASAPEPPFGCGCSTGAPVAWALGWGSLLVAAGFARRRRTIRGLRGTFGQAPSPSGGGGETNRPGGRVLARLRSARAAVRGLRAG